MVGNGAVVLGFCGVDRAIKSQQVKVEEGTPVIALLSEPVVASHTRGNIQEVKARGAVVTTIAMEGVEQEGDDFIVPAVPILLVPLVSVVVTQLIAYYTSLGKGLDVDKPRNLAKSVTVE